MDKNKNKVWVLFSVANEYAQPEHNLVAWWIEQPSCVDLEKVIRAEDNFSEKETKKRFHDLIGMVQRGCNVRFKSTDIDYELRQIEEGKVI